MDDQTRIELEAAAFRRRDVLLTGVTVIEIKAWDESNTALVLPLNGAACDPVRRLSVTIEAARGGVTDRLTTKVFLRSMMEGMGP